MIERVAIERMGLFLSAAFLIAAPGLSAQGRAMPGQQQGGMPSQQGGAMPGMMGQGNGMAMGMGGMMEMLGQGMMGAGMMGPGMMGMMGQGVGIMSTGGPGPSAILGMGDALGLTAEQRTRLQEIQQDFGNTIEPLMTRAMEAQDRATDALQRETPDFDAYQSALRDASDEMIQAHVDMARAAFDARQVLTDEQRTKLQGGMQMLQGMMGQGGSAQGRMMGPMGSGGGR